MTSTIYDDYEPKLGTAFWNWVSYYVQYDRFEERVGEYLQYHYYIRGSFDLLEVRASTTTSIC